MGSILGHLANPPVAKKKAAAKPKVMKKESIGQRGKDAEKDTEEVLKEWNDKLSTFAYERLPDARSSRGMVKAQISDFMIWFKKSDGTRLCIPLEVKSTEHAGGYLLSKSALEQLPRLNKSRLAGTYPFVLVYFKATFKWRIESVEFFKFGQPSWHMGDLPTFDTAKEALQSTGYFPLI